VFYDIAAGVVYIVDIGVVIGGTGVIVVVVVIRVALLLLPLLVLLRSLS